MKSRSRRHQGTTLPKRRRSIGDSPARLQRDLAYWQERLVLRDWAITARFGYESEFSNKDAIAETSLSLSQLDVRIVIQSRGELASNGYDPLPDPEVSLVHELLHIRVEPARLELAEDSSARLQLEAALTVAAEALVALRHQRRK